MINAEISQNICVVWVLPQTMIENFLTPSIVAVGKCISGIEMNDSNVEKRVTRSLVSGELPLMRARSGETLHILRAERSGEYGERASDFA